MALLHCYFGVENLGLNATQRQTLIAELRSLGPASDSSPARLNHWRTRPDNDAAIFEALFNEDHLTIDAFKNRLAAIFGISATQISHSVTAPSFSVGNSTTVVVFSRPAGTQRLRLALFGGPGTTLEVSHAEALGYLAANAAAWGIESA